MALHSYDLVTNCRLKRLLHSSFVSLAILYSGFLDSFLTDKIPILSDPRRIDDRYKDGFNNRFKDRNNNGYNGESRKKFFSWEDNIRDR